MAPDVCERPYVTSTTPQTISAPTFAAADKDSDPITRRRAATASMNLVRVSVVGNQRKSNDALKSLGFFE